MYLVYITDGRTSGQVESKYACSISLATMVRLSLNYDSVLKAQHTIIHAVYLRIVRPVIQSERPGTITPDAA